MTVDGGSEAANRQAAVDLAERVVLPGELEDVDLAGAEGGDDDRPMSVGQVMGVDELEPGTYFIYPDGDPSTPVRVLYDVAEEGWQPWLGAARINDGPHTNLTITTVTNVVADACRNHSPADPPVGPSVDDLATALSELAPFEVTAPPSEVTLFGYEGTHLQLTIPDGPFTECEDEQQFHSWVAPLLGGAYHGYNGPEPGLTEDFWILDVDGTRLVIETNTSPDASPEALAELQAIFDSIRIEP